MERVFGIDVSHWAPVTDWDKVVAAGVSIFGAKATNGLGVDPTFAMHRDGARAQPFDMVVHYHFPTPKSSAVAQADHLVELVEAGGGLRPNERLALDVEWDEQNQWCPDVRFVDEFVQETVRMVGDRRMFIYTSARVWSTYLKNPSWPGSFVTDAWLAHYGDDDPELPVDAEGFPVWPKWSMWQQSETFDCPGVSGPCDRDVWRGDRDDLRAYALGKGAAVVAP